MVLEDFFAPSLFYPSTHISTRPQRVLPIEMTGDGSLHKAMPHTDQSQGKLYTSTSPYTNTAM